MSLLIFGANGQLGRRLAAQAPDCAALSRRECDFSQPNELAIERLLEAYQPSHILNAAAYTQVDQAESEPELAQRVNGETPRLLAEIARRRGIPFIHFSTDYVFDGSEAPYAETAPTGPLNAYGRSKLYGEQAALDAGGTVFRLQWLYDTTGRNFFLTMRALLAERERLTVVADQRGTPSFVPHIATAVLQSLDAAPGVYHLVPGGDTSWHGFACAIRARIGSHCAIAPITTAEYPAPAPRPKDTRMNNSKLALTVPHWREGLNEACDAIA